MLHPVGVVFKGSGWYITDSRKSPPSENGASEKSEKADKKVSKPSETGTKSESSEKPKVKAAAAADD